MRTAKRILAEFMTVVMVLQACSPTVAAVAAGWQNISSEIATASAEASDTAESGETKSDAATGSGSSDTGADSDSAGDSAAKDDAATGDTVDSAAGSDSAGDQAEGDDVAGDAAADDAEQDADAAASEDAETQADVTIKDLNKLVERLEKKGAENIKLKADGDGIQSLDVTVSTAFTVLSNADASLYYDAQININMSGDAKLTETVDNLSFQGFGSDTHPFEGKIYRSDSPKDPVELTADRTVFNNLKLTDQNNTIKIKWVGATTYSEPMVASKVIGEGKELGATVGIADPVSTDTSNDKTSALTAPLLGETTGDLTVNVTYSLTYSLTGSRKNLNVSASSNIGLLANTVKNGTFTVGSIEFPDNLAAGGVVKTSSGNAGLLVGAVEDGATLNVGTLTNVPTATVQSTNGCAGGVVGLVGSSTGATVNVTEALDLQPLTVKGTTASGGLIGKATKLTLGAGNKQVTCPAAVGDANSENVGGFIGEVSFASSAAFTGNDQVNTGEGVTLAGKFDESKGVGAVIGKLNYDDLTAAASVSFAGGTFESTYGNGGGAAVFGGIVGSVTGCANSKPLHIEGVTAEFALEASPQFTGGLVGWLGRRAGATLEVKKATVKCTKLAQSGKGFGGVAGCLDNKSIVDVKGVTVENAGKIENGAGVVAESWGSVIRLGGVTNFSGMKFAPDKSFVGKKVVSQIANVRVDNPTLVFACGTGSDKVASDDDNADYWVYKRCQEVKIDDLGGAQDSSSAYGQVIRLDGEKLQKDLIKVNMNDHTLEAPSTDDWSWQVGSSDGKWSDNNRTFTIKNTQDFVCLALTVQFPGLWNGVYGFGGTDGSVLLAGVTINLTGNVDLTGTGVEGLGFDNASKPQPFTGTLNGNNHTITLAIGEPYGMRSDSVRGDTPIASNDTTAGNGKIYRRSRLGLFSAIGSGTTGATVSGLTIDGSMRFDNGLPVDAGSLAATITGDVVFDNVVCGSAEESAKLAITCDDTFGNDANVGGIAGSVTGAATVAFINSTTAKSAIKTDGTLNGNARIGGAIGYVGDATVTVNASGLTVGGSIVAGESASSKKIAQVGGFIGSIAQGDQINVQNQANVATVNITGLVFDSFAMTVGKNGDAKNGAGGLLGYSWGNANVTIGDANKNASDSTYALKATGSSITAKDSGELGGLVYAASGHWVINDYAIDLSGASINANTAKTLGVLVGRGCKVNNTVTYGVEKYAGLYLENRAPWKTAYKVEGIDITDSKVEVFDEWVGNGVRPGSKLMDGDWNTVVSLHTEGEKLDMSGDPTKDNSYHNRSAFGETHNTNGNTRYYYNLDRAYANVEKNGFSKGRLDTAEKLLLWSAYRYAPVAIRSMIVPTNVTGLEAPITIGGTTEALIDLSGYSYYPTQPGSNVTVQNAAITFHYSDIKAEQTGNKLNSDATQHENMHCGLLRTVPNGDLTVKSVTLAGTVGPVVNDERGSSDDSSAGGSSSGALVCRYIMGSQKDGKTTIRTIAIEGLTLDGLTVDGANEATGSDAYMPLLINEMQSYVKLDVKNITAKGYDGKTKAATSLFGKLGVGSSADQVTATFSTISVPSATNNTIFTHASLLESFGYGDGKTGSAVYTFVKADQTNNKVTFGNEIDANGENNEYKGKQLWYYDEEGYQTDANLVTVDRKTADKTGKSPQFGGYLPYVYKGYDKESNPKYHEIKVNQRVPPIKVGCGTYGDPYTIAKASELSTVADYINTQSASDGWEVTIQDQDQTRLCQRRTDGADTSNEVTYVYKQANTASKKWEKKIGETTDPNTTLDDDTMHRYLQSAYYSIEPVDADGNATDTLALDASAFQGLGNSGNPFRGVVVGNLRGMQKADTPATVKIDNTNSTSTLAGLIPYSYGSVVSNIKVEYAGKAVSVAYKDKDGSGVPGAFFGGVIGCVLGGDNIIDGVSVKASGSFNVAGDSHLVPIGGYVGVITGGGVIFRNSSNVSGALDAWHGAGASLYDNPYVGRVIDGYAFSELTDGSLDNTDRNYKVNNLNAADARCIVTDDTQGRYRGDGSKNTENLAITTTVKDSQGLLVLSAIISSGAAGGSANTKETSPDYGTYAGSRAYLGGYTSTNKAGYQFGNQNYGKVRNASYGAVGQPANAEVDFPIAIKDDRLSPGDQAEGNALDHNDATQMNSPYLVSKYATWQTGNICAAQASGMDLQFVNSDKDIDYDMTPYGTGYTGLSGRYYSNACASTKGADRDRIVPLVATINGNGATIRVGGNGSDGSEKKPYNIKEYADDDCKLTGVGALFGTVTYTSANVSGSIGTPATNDTAATGNSSCTVQNLKFDDCNISLSYVSFSAAATGDKNIPSNPPSSVSEAGVGLLAGTTANASSLKDYGKYNTVTMTNSRVEGPNNVGGLLGASGYGSRRTDANTTWMVNTNDTANNENRYSPVKLYDCSYSGMDISGVQNVGGFVGKLNNNSAGGVWTKANTSIAESSTILSTASTARTGGIVGLVGGGFLVNSDDAGVPLQGAGKATISNVTLRPAAVSGATEGTGGLIGRSENGTVSVYNLCVKGDAANKTMFGVQGSENLKYVAGAIGEAASGGALKFDSCEIKDIYLGARECSAGLIGDLSRGLALEVENSTITGLVVDGSYSGGVVGSIGSTASSIALLNSTIGENNFTGSKSAVWKPSLGSCSGGVSGDGRGSYKLVNVLIDSNAFGAQGSQGNLFGNTSSSDLVNLFAAGIAIRPDGANGSPELIRDSSGTDDLKKVNKKSYIAFGDYEDKLSDADGATLYGNDDAAGNVTAAVSPYVTTSPKSGLAVRASDTDATDRYLFGDGMKVGLAATIQGQKDPNVSGRYIYTNIGGINDKGAYQNTSSYDASSVASMFNANNDASGNKVKMDFPVLVISGTDNTTVTSYLNIITNGGFSDACRLNNENGTNPHVTAKAEVFQLNNGVFVKDEEASNNPTLRVANNGKNNMSFSPSSDWDNGKGRFTLLTVTFAEAGQSYNVQVPIIVKRKLEIDFTATYDYGTNFKESNYAQLGKDAHVLTSFGEPMTGLLTWTYNSANGTEVDFGWDSYMAAGGSMKGLGKSILFEGAEGRLPQGTQLTLVDANVDGKAGGREYHYTVGEGGATSVSLSGGDGFKDSADNPYQERWLSEILDVSATKDGTGTWAVCDNEADATAKAKFDGKWMLFKVAGADVSADKRYTLTVPKDNGKEKRASESVYLVVNVPKSTGVSKINGFTNTPGSFDSSSSRVAVNMHRVLRPNNANGGKETDIQNNTASTYSILSNYGQVVVDKKGKARTLVSQSQDGAAYVLSLDVTDTITFNTDQIYATNDSLFYQLDTSLCQYDANDTLNGVSSFPSGTSAIAEFYVAIGSQYYTWDSADKKWVTCDASTSAFTQTVTDTGNDSLKLTLEHNLAGIRALANGSFTVRTVVKEIRLTPDGCNDVIALSQQSGEDACTKMSYIAKLSTRKSGLDTSSLAVTTRGHVGYYRMNKGGATITLSAPDKSQLGINVDDLRPIANGTIGLGATYEVGGLNNATEAIANAGSVVYTLRLQRRSGTYDSYEDVTGKISDYVTVTESKLATVNAADNAITFTDSTKENGKFRTQNGDTTFNLPFTVKVNTQVEQRDQFYANYRLVMTASLVTSDVASATPQSPDYVTYTLTRVNLNGIDHSSETN